MINCDSTPRYSVPCQEIKGETIEIDFGDGT